MFIRTQSFLTHVESAASANAQAAELRIAVAECRTTIDWLRQRVNVLEKERAILMREVTHLNVPIPEISAPQNAMSTTVPPGMALPNFEDIGDDAAKQLGISHDGNGELQFDS